MSSRILCAVLGAALLAPLPLLAQEEAAVIPTGDQCTYPVDLLWHREPKDAPATMGVSVVNKASGQQVPGLNASHFAVAWDNQQAPNDESFQVQQSANAFKLVEPTDSEGAAEPQGVDPVNYDVYFAVDLTASMAEELAAGSSDKKSSKLRWALRLIVNFIQPDKQGSSLFDSKDRVYISGFTDKVEAEFMSSTTAERKKIREALAKINEFAPKSDAAALYASMLHNLSNIESRGDQYKDASKKREAVLIVITDSFNGMDLESRRALRGCDQNDPLADEVGKAILKAQQATNNGLKMYLLALGEEGETKRYSLTEPANRRCRIAETQAEVVDGRAFRALGERGLTRGGYRASTNPAELGGFVRSQFEALKSAYEITYQGPEGVSSPRSFMVQVKLGDAVCADEERLQSNIIPQARATDIATSPGEFALFLAGLILAMFFLPRSMTNLTTLGGGGGAPKKRKKAPAKKKRRKKG